MDTQSRKWQRYRRQNAVRRKCDVAMYEVRRRKPMGLAELRARLLADQEKRKSSLGS